MSIVLQDRLNNSEWNRPGNVFQQTEPNTFKNIVAGMKMCEEKKTACSSASPVFLPQRGFYCSLSNHMHLRKSIGQKTSYIHKRDKFHRFIILFAFSGLIAELMARLV